MSVTETELPEGNGRRQPKLAALPSNFLRQKPRKPRSNLGIRRDWRVVPGIGYRLEIPDLLITFDITRMRPRFDETWGLLTVRAGFAGAKVITDHILSSGDFSFSNMRSRQERAKDLEVRAGAGAEEIDWRGLLEELCIKVLDHEERGSPEVALADVVMPTTEYDPEMTAGGMPVLRQHPVIWFGDGGCAKSLLAMFAAIDLAQSGLRVLYCDWELAPDEHARRMRQLVGDPSSIRSTLFYRRCERPFVDDILPIREILAKRSIQFLICDSLSFGAKAPIESSESATGYMQALRECGPIGSLHIAHTNRSEQADERPFGSTYWHNMARATLFMKRSDNNEGTNEITIGCYPRKTNLTERREAFARRVQFSKDQIWVGPGDLADDDALIKNLKLPQKIRLALQQSGPLTEVALRDECGEAVKAESLGRVVRRLTKKGVLIRFMGADGIDRLRLANAV